MQKWLALCLAVVITVVLIRLPAEPSCPQDFHYSYFSTQEFFDDAYAAAPTTTPQAARGLLVNHHLLAASLIATALESAATTSTRTVLLVSPNHFGAGESKIISSIYQWRTPYGVVASDCTAIAALAQRKVLAVEEAPFENEHGISTIVPFIKRSLPNARLVPIIIKDSLSEQGRVALAEELYRAFPDALVIGSFDFSHEVPNTVAQLHDQRSLAVIKQYDYDELHAVEDEKEVFFDSPPGLEVVLRYLQKEGAHFVLQTNTNSALITGKDFESVTSYITGFFVR